MMLEIRYGDDSLVIDVDSRFEQALQGKIPFTTTLNVWKEEVYFETPVDFDISGLKDYIRVESGKLYYWPPGKGFCIFYGFSQPYSPVYSIGSYVGVLDRLRTIEDGVKATVQAHKPAEVYSGIISKLESMDFKVSTPLYGGEQVVEAVGLIEGRRISLRLYIEDYGIHLEGEPFFPHDYNPSTLRLVGELAALLSGEKYVRLDLNESHWVTITGYIKDLSDLEEAIKELGKAYCRITRKSTRRRIRPL